MRSTQSRDLHTRGFAFHVLVQEQDFADLLFDGMERVQRGLWLLKDHADLFAADFAHEGIVLADQFLAVEFDARSFRVRGAGIWQELHDGQGRHRFS